MFSASVYWGEKKYLRCLWSLVRIDLFLFFGWTLLFQLAIIPFSITGFLIRKCCDGSTAKSNDEDLLSKQSSEASIVYSIVGSTDIDSPLIEEGSVVTDMTKSQI